MKGRSKLQHVRSHCLFSLQDAIWEFTSLIFCKQVKYNLSISLSLYNIYIYIYIHGERTMYTYQFLSILFSKFKNLQYFQISGRWRGGASSNMFKATAYFHFKMPFQRWTTHPHYFASSLVSHILFISTVNLKSATFLASRWSVNISNLKHCASEWARFCVYLICSFTFHIQQTHFVFLYLICVFIFDLL